jgi:hypothetical protein
MMSTSNIIYLGGFFFILGAGLIGLIWIITSLVRTSQNKGNGSVSSDPDLSVLARLLRDVKTQDLVVEMDGKSFKTVNELTPAQQHRLSFTSGVLAKWVSLPIPPLASDSSDQSIPAVSPDSAERSVPTVTPETSVSPDVAGEPLPASQTDPAWLEALPNISDWIPAETVPSESIDHHIPPFSVDPSPEVKPVSTSITDVVGSILNPPTIPAPVFKSIAMQIDDILQGRIAGTTFESRHISLSDGPDHGVLVTMDGQKYPGVKDVPDEDVRNLIRSAVLEWEKQTKAASK